jgi:hypothetical protein
MQYALLIELQVLVLTFKFNKINSINERRFIKCSIIFDLNEADQIKQLNLFPKVFTCI